MHDRNVIKRVNDKQAKHDKEASRKPFYSPSYFGTFYFGEYHILSLCILSLAIWYVHALISATIFSICRSTIYLKCVCYCIYCKLGAVKYFVETLYVDVNTKGAFQRTPLMEAARGGQIETMKYLLSRGADHKSKDQHGSTAFHLAVLSGQFGVVKYFTEVMHFDVNTQDDSGQTPIIYAVKSGNTLAVNYLLEAGANLEAKDDDGATAFHVAIEKADANMVRYFVETLHCDIRSTGSLKRTPLMYAAQSGSLEKIKYLLSSGANFRARDAEGSTALHLAALYGQLDVVKYLVEVLKADVNEPGFNNLTALAYATKDGPVAQYLIGRSSNNLDENKKQKNGANKKQKNGANKKQKNSLNKKK